MSIDETAMLLSGQMVRNRQGTFYFDQPGNWINEYGYPNEAHLHRLDGPAAIWANGDQEWHLNGLRHRINGPAAIWTDAGQQWWVDGKYIK